MFGGNGRLQLVLANPAQLLRAVEVLQPLGDQTLVPQAAILLFQEQRLALLRDARLLA